MAYPIMNRRLFALLFIFLCPCAEAEPLKNVTFDETYELFYQEAFREMRSRAGEAVPRAYDQIVQAWGLPNQGGPTHPVRIEIKQLASDTIMRWQSGYVQTEGSGKEMKQKLVLDIGSYLQSDKKTFSDLITHEMAHIVLHDQTAEDVFPSWFDEGLAQSVSTEGHNRVKIDRENAKRSGMAVLPCDLDASVNEFVHGPFNARCYSHYYLAVRRLRQLGKPDVIQKVIQGYAEKKKNAEAVAPWVGISWEAFKEDADRYSKDVLAGKKPIP